LQNQQSITINNQGVAEHNRGNYAEAIRLFEQALALATDPTTALKLRHNLANSYSFLARAAQDRGDLTEALRMIELSIRYYPDEPDMDWHGWAETLRGEIAEREQAIEEARRERTEQFTEAEGQRLAAAQQLKSESLRHAEEQLNAARGRIREQQAAAQGPPASGGNTKFFGTSVGPGAAAAGPTVAPGPQTSYSSTGEQLQAAASSPEAAACVFTGQAGCPAGQPFQPLKLSSNSAAFKTMAAKIATNEKLVADQPFIERFNWYRHLDVQMTETKAKLTEIQKQIDGNKGDREILNAEKGSLENTAKLLEADAAKAKKWMDERAKTLSITLDWPEEGPASPSQAGPAPQQQPAGPD